MAHTNSTPNYGLPQFIGDDKPTFLGDMNEAFSDIDTAMKANQVSAQEANAGVATNAGAITGLQGDVGGLDTRLTAVEGVARQNRGNINTINSLIGNGTPTTTDQTLIGAINELNAGKVNKNDGVSKYTGTHLISVAHDGVKTYTEVINELFTSLQTYVASKGSNYRMVVNSMTGNDSIHNFVGTNTPDLVFGNLIGDTYVIRFSGVSAPVLLTYMSKKTGSTAAMFDITNGTYTDLSSTVASSGNASLLITEYEIV